MEPQRPNSHRRRLGDLWGSPRDPEREADILAENLAGQPMVYADDDPDDDNDATVHHDATDDPPAREPVAVPPPPIVDGHGRLAATERLQLVGGQEPRGVRRVLGTLRRAVHRLAR